MNIENQRNLSRRHPEKQFILFTSPPPNKEGDLGEERFVFYAGEYRLYKKIMPAMWAYVVMTRSA